MPFLDLDLAVLQGAEALALTVFYVNAKAMLPGESSVGKSGLGIRIAEGKFRKTASTDGAPFWHFPTGQLPALPSNVEGGLTPSNLVGQPEHRLTQQFFWMTGTPRCCCSIAPARTIRFAACLTGPRRSTSMSRPTQRDTWSRPAATSSTVGHSHADLPSPD